MPSLGFNDSTSLFMYLRQCQAKFGYDRICGSEENINENIKDLRKFLKSDKEKRGFIFVMNVPNSTAIDTIAINGMSKDTFIKYLKLRAFS